MPSSLMYLLILACCATAVMSQAPFICNPVVKDCADPSDIVFLLDGSGSVTRRDLNKSLQFIVSITRRFTISPTEIQVALVIFSKRAWVVFKLTQYYNHEALEEAILAVEKYGGGTRTDRAMDLLHTEMFQPENGGRDNAIHLGIVITDGKPSVPELAHASYQKVKDAGILIVAVGIGKVEVSELQLMATTPNDVFYVQTFDLLADIAGLIQARACELPTVFAACSNLLDIVLILDTSGSISVMEYAMELNFAAELSTRFRIGAGNVRIGAVTYSYTANLLFHLNAYSNSSTLAEAFRNATDAYVGSNTQTHLALDKVVEEKMFSTANGGREDAPDIVIILTDAGHADEIYTAEAISRVKSLLIRVIAVGFGKELSLPRLKLMASSDDDVFPVADVASLDNITNNLIQLVCPEVGPCPVRQVCNRPQDIVFLIDSSGSENSLAYGNYLWYIDLLTQRFDVGPQQVQFGAVLFNDTYQTLFYLNSYQHQGNLSKAILAAPQLGGHIDIRVAVDYIRLNMFTTANGGRPDAMKVVVLVHGPDLRSGDGPSVNAFTNLKNTGVRVIVLGIGFEANARAFASVYETDKFSAVGFYDLPKILEVSGAWICNLPKYELRCKSSVNILFVVESVNITEFLEGLRFARDLSAQFKLAVPSEDNNALFALSVFNTVYYREVISLTQYSYPDQLSEAILNAPLLGGSPGLDTAVYNSFNSEPFQNRPNPDKRLVVFLTSGRGTEDFDRPDLLRDHTGVYNDIISVPLGDSPNKNSIRNLATTPASALSGADQAAMEYIIGFASGSKCAFTTVE